MFISMYSRSKHTRNLAGLLLAVMLAAAGYKSYASWSKADLYEQAAKAQEAGHELEAEALFQRASANTAIRYKNEEIDAALNALRPVTELKRTLGSIAGQMHAATQVNDVPTLLQAYESFQQVQTEYASRSEADQKRLAEAEASYRVEEGLAQSFADVKTQLEQSLENGAADKSFDSGNAMQYLLQIPAAYYKDEKTKKQQLNELFKAYDQKRLDALFQTKSFPEVVDETQRLRKFYTAGGVQAEWLLPQFETYAQNALASLLKKNDLTAFISYSKKYQGTKELTDGRPKLSSYIQASIKTQFTRAQQLAAAKKFAEAIDLYTVLNAYQDTSKEAADTEQRWLEADPAQLLRKATGAKADAVFTNVQSAKGAWGAKLAAVGIAADGELVLARLAADQKLDYASAALGKQLAVQALKLSGPLGGGDQQPAVVIEAASKSRRARYVAVSYEPRSAELKTVLDVEADGFAPDRSRPGTLIVDNPTGEAAGRQAYYEFQGGQYVFAKVKSDVLDIALSELPKQKTGAIIRFQCQIASVDGNTAVVRLGNDVVLLSGNVRFRTGPAVVTGTLLEKSAADGKESRERPQGEAGAVPGTKSPAAGSSPVPNREAEVSAKATKQADVPGNADGSPGAGSINGAGPLPDTAPRATRGSGAAAGANQGGATGVPSSAAANTYKIAVIELTQDDGGGFSGRSANRPAQP
ncbi:hypothetical protein SK3146_03030 [Paenibacillus konkukensis]|uniref:Uncharacterized protein n=1 Tax=Paenibacillus konkukensis TaxID=2020716 RepID=A0ABY4RNW6_9BACL|nr:hypothetical protein [Paenibacillus konkukensis]UQZ83823.1 hypothetical protein SK3146_03030 [Paenibacillus konkukensis]